MGKNVVQLARDPAPLGDCRRTQLLFPCVLELGKQQLGCILAHTRLLMRSKPHDESAQGRNDQARSRRFVS